MSDEQQVTTTNEGSSQPSTPALSASQQLRANAENLFGSHASKAVSTNETPRGESQSINPKFQKEDSNGSESDQLPTKDDTNATNLEADKQQPKVIHGKSGDKRFQQMANQIRELKELLKSQGGQAPASAEAKPTEAPSLIPKPNKPAYTKKQLDDAEKLARSNGDEGLLNAVNQERESLRQFELDERFWKLENEKALSKYQETQNHYIQEAVKKWPDIAKSDSEHYQTFERLSQRVPELLARPQGDGHYLLAEVAYTYLQNKELASRLAALETKSKQTETENTGLKKKIAPAVQTKSLNLGASNGKKLTAGDELRQRMAALEEAGMLGR
jgi:hypothetical protein